MSTLVALKTLIFTVIVPGTVAVWIPRALLSSPDARRLGFLGDFHYAGLVPMTIGVSIYLWCAWDFGVAGKGTPAPIDPPKDLVVRGLYTFVRNPMYVGVLSLVLGEAIWFESPLLFGYAILVFVLFSAFVIFYEEPVLRTKFGDSYRRYCEVTPRWIPALRRRW